MIEWETYVEHVDPETGERSILSHDQGRIDGMTDRQASIDARDAAIERVEEHADARWKGAAWNALHRVLARKKEFIAADVFAEIPEHLRDVREPRAMGAIIKAAQQAKLIEPTDRHRATDSVRSHRRPQRVWAVPGHGTGAEGAARVERSAGALLDALKALRRAWHDGVRPEMVRNLSRMVDEVIETADGGKR